MNVRLSDYMDTSDTEGEHEQEKPAAFSAPSAAPLAAPSGAPVPAPVRMPANDELPGACRVQSPSSIVTYNQCPRKYYYRYIEKLPSGKSIHLVRGSIIHKVLEEIYDLDVKKLPDEKFSYTLSVVLHEAFRKAWYEASDQLSALGLSPEELDEYFTDGKQMIENFFHYLYDRMRPLLQTLTEKQAFVAIRPRREVFLQSATNLVKGYIDAIQKELDGRTVIIDYKTSKKLEITPEYRLQLSIYAMMHEEHHHTPDEVGILFLKHGRELRLPVDSGMIEEARQACLDVQLKTCSLQLADYPKKPSPLCKWSTGQCEFYDLCFLGKSVEEFRKEMR